MKKLMLVLAAAGVATLAGCEEPRSETIEATPPPIEESAPPPPAETAPTVEAAPEPTPPTSTTALPPDERASEETVKPESETLFY